MVESATPVGKDRTYTKCNPGNLNHKSLYNLNNSLRLHSIVNIVRINVKYLGRVSALILNKHTDNIEGLRAEAGGSSHEFLGFSEISYYRHLG